jgi:hypothetical protein
MSVAIGYLDRLLDPLTEAFTPEFATSLVELRADPALEQRLADLRRAANAGTITPDDQAEYEELVEALDVIALLQLKARRFLADRS